VAAVFASFNACSLQSNGLIPLDGSANVAAPDGAETSSPEAAPDAPRGDGCGAVETSCLNGLDDDCNGLVDCADPACAPAYSCVPAPSDGFEGFAVYEDDRSSACPAAYGAASDTFETLIFFPASCGACSCEARGGSCGAAKLTCSTAGTCAADGGESVLLGEGCTALDGGIALGPSVSCALGAPSATAGTCAADGGAPLVTSVSLGQLARACGATEGPGAGCATGSVCVAKPPSGSHGACVFKATDDPTACPAGYGSAHTTMPSATSFTDSRGCTSCNCTGPTGAACTGAATLYPSAGCADAGALEDAGAVSLPADGGCSANVSTTNEALGSAVLDAVLVTPGVCAATGGQPTGAVTAKDLTVYCCQN